MKLLFFIGATCLVSGVGRCQQADKSKDMAEAHPRVFGLMVSQDESLVDSLSEFVGIKFTVQTGEDETSVGDSSKIYYSNQVSLSYSKPEGRAWRLLGLTVTCDSCFGIQVGRVILVGSSIADVTEEYPELAVELDPEVVADSARLSRVGSLSLPFDRDVDHVSVYRYGLVHVYFRKGMVSRFAVQHQLE